MMIEKVVTWCDIRAGDFIRTELNGIVCRVTKCEMVGKKLFIFLEELYPVEGPEYHREVGGLERVLLAHRPWYDAKEQRRCLDRINRFLNYASGLSEAAKKGIFLELYQAIGQYELSTPIDS